MRGADFALLLEITDELWRRIKERVSSINDETGERREALIGKKAGRGGG